MAKTILLLHVTDGQYNVSTSIDFDSIYNEKERHTAHGNYR
jgi:hypothetical protein